MEPTPKIWDMGFVAIVIVAFAASSWVRLVLARKW